MNEAPYSEEEKLAYLLGQIKALSAIVQVMLAAQPNSKSILEKSDALVKKIEDRSLFEAIPDAYADGLADLRSSFEKAIAIFEAHGVFLRKD